MSDDIVSLVAQDANVEIVDASVDSDVPCSVSASDVNDESVDVSKVEREPASVDSDVPCSVVDASVVNVESFDVSKVECEPYIHGDRAAASDAIRGAVLRGQNEEVLFLSFLLLLLLLSICLQLIDELFKRKENI